MAVREKNRTNVAINRHFIIRVLEHPNALPANLHAKNTKLTSANKLSNYLQDEEMKIRLFDEVLYGKKQQYTFKIRNRLKIVFQSK